MNNYTIRENWIDRLEKNVVTLAKSVSKQTTKSVFFCVEFSEIVEQMDRSEIPVCSTTVINEYDQYPTASNKRTRIFCIADWKVIGDM